MNFSIYTLQVSKELRQSTGFPLCESSWADVAREMACLGKFEPELASPTGRIYLSSTDSKCEARLVQGQDRPVPVVQVVRSWGRLFYFCVAAGEESTSDKCPS